MDGWRRIGVCLYIIMRMRISGWKGCAGFKV
jgi:hypothetical protein